MTLASRPMTALALVAFLSACSDGVDFDLRGGIGGKVDTTDAALKATADRPEPDDRGIISYPSYQVAVARRGDTLADVAARIGLPADELSRYNGIRPSDALRQGEIVALPRRVSEPSPLTGAATTGPIRPPSGVDVTTLASNAIDGAPDTSRRGAKPQTGVEPVRHKVARGETAFTIARLYNVSPRALSEWNALDRDFSIREGQFLLIPAAKPGEPRSADPVTTPPGSGSPTPVPPSAAAPLPSETPEPRSTDPAPKPEEPVADIGQSKAKAKGSMTMPVSGSIIREYSPGTNPGIDISASPGTPVVAADSGSVISVSKKTNGSSFIIVRHANNVNTVYLNVADIGVNVGDSVSRGQQIARVAPGEVGFLHFEVRQGLDSADPMSYLR
ncbi:peptidoglycan DD-metalloendopeptidase family protein [Mameliella sediminis]|uniref:peptidoglycan DD-metalloendopeptidase family protein n=1 Tax=Mameliella sediminis TaxID=2836866 RepID=UPI001C48A070|nr:peptidoglycan DD-metalloendopeptidase family protein [Mameliella sediminis]MBY6114673.1 peptidoglycan DD-metalloendopeptidase family protein [Antarctobacter heliothermus]MBY6144246.1 peptidoglycan DD-metalloendopeptidase family protein [Mameliella alba]MBV7392846.1 peptidoglycan DD-metalloendopeptidase family protein [Mameliella sediminis]MBY6161462.1 peptidoglycan DD-metalloendopeptidase family protein [Mameliella alba]MBY6170072.1 peptidoglycan DD-metalloendopeptidase family protein [Mame